MTNRWKLKAGEAWQESGLVFTTRYGLAIDPRNFNRSFKRRAELADVPVIPVHSTRRTCASLLVELGVHPRVAMAIMRHSQISVTMNIYSQVASASAREALSNLGARLAEGGHP
jgi:integrase